MHGLVALDSNDRVLRPAILWNDQRTASECVEIEQTVGLQRLIELTGNRALPGFTAPKLLWLRRHEPDVYRRIARIALPRLRALRLCGEHTTDVADASGHCCSTSPTGAGARRWSPPRARRRVATSSLGKPGGFRHNVGCVPVAAGRRQAAGALGVGVDRPGPVSVVLGTSGVVFAALERFAADAEARVHAFCHAVPNSWHAMG